MEDGLWEGWIEFLPDDGSPVLRSRRETVQSNRETAIYWATGLSPVYLEGALARTLAPPPRPAPPPDLGTPAYPAAAAEPWREPAYPTTTRVPSKRRRLKPANSSLPV